MLILVLNIGSTSIKSSLYEAQGERVLGIGAPLWEGEALWKNNFEEVVVSSCYQGKTSSSSLLSDSLEGVLSALMGELRQLSFHLEKINLVGHRMVHGGDYFSNAVEATDAIVARLEGLCSVAPLHNPVALQGLSVMKSLCPLAKQIVVFDTSFHRTMPEAVAVYPVPYSWYERGLHRYGFHGINYAHCARVLAQKGGKRERVVICHLGSGASLCALKDGKSVNTTMGFTPLEGLAMNRRSGSIDPGLLLHLLQTEGWSVEQLSHALYHESGLLGVSGFSGDMRDIVARREKKDRRAMLAFDVYMHRLVSEFGAMVATLGGLDAVVFTGGIAEHSMEVRQALCERVRFLGLLLSLEKNKESSDQDRLISEKESTVDIWVIPAKEAEEIAKQCLRWGRSDLN